MMAAPPFGDVVLDVPATPRSLRLLRLAAADAAADMGLDIEGVEGARIAIDELASVLLATGTWSRLRVGFDRADDGLRVQGTVLEPQGEVTAPFADRIVEELLRVCVTEYRLENGDGSTPLGPTFVFRVASST